MVFKVIFSCGCWVVMNGGKDAYNHKVYGCPKGERGDKKHLTCQEVDRYIIG